MSQELKDLFEKIAESGDESEIKDEEYKSIERRKLEAETRRLELENQSLEGDNIGDSQDRNQRKEFAERIFSFVCLYMFAVFLILFLCGSSGRFNLSDTVLMTLLGTTTANVIGILIIVVTYLFSRNRKRK